MPNIVHLPICPFYKYEKRKSICCEDTYRGFKSAEDKYSWMYMYCDSWDWMRCPYAVDLNEAYERLEKGDDKALEKLERDAMKKEMKSLSTKLGKAEKKIERMQKKIDELRSVNMSFNNVNENLEKQKKEFYRRWREAQDKIDKGDEQIRSELLKLGARYEQRMCYLIDAFAPGQIVYEEDIEAWAKDREFALLHEYIDVNDPDKRRTGLIWKVVFNEETEEDGQQDQDIQTDVQEGQEVRQQEGAD